MSRIKVIEKKGLGLIAAIFHNDMNLVLQQ